MLASRGASRHARRRPTMRDALSRRSGDGVPEPLPPPPGPPPTPGPPIPPRPTPPTHPEATLRARSSHVTRRPPPPTHPEATRAGRHDRPPRPTALNDPAHHTRETHSDAFATTLRTRRTRPSRPPPRPSRPTSSKPPLNNLPGKVGVDVEDHEGYSAGGGARGRRRAHGGALLLGPLTFRWTTYVPLDHLRAVGPPYFVNQVVQRNVSGPTAFKWSKQIGGVTTCETPSHHAGRPVGRSRCGTPEPPRRRPVRLR